jgi:2-dehydro-3-deoxy-D-arabinonate dehydratase
MKLCRFLTPQKETHIGLLAGDDQVLDLSEAGVKSITFFLEAKNALEQLTTLSQQKLTRFPLDQIQLLSPVEDQEVWGAGVTYLRSMKARMEESTSSASVYDRVYNAPRPQLFFKSLPEKVSGPGGPTGIRKDSKWNAPEPELGLVFNSQGVIAGYTIGNDQSSRDVEGENVLYQPQAKIYRHSCAIGPCIVIGATEEEARAWTIRAKIFRDGAIAFEGESTPNQIKRPFEEFGTYMFRCQSYPKGAILLSGTGIVPPDNFTLQAGDRVRIEISGIGVLENPVIIV